MPTNNQLIGIYKNPKLLNLSVVGVYAVNPLTGLLYLRMLNLYFCPEIVRIQESGVRSQEKERRFDVELWQFILISCFLGS
jgi:hypothetical protein